LHKLPIARYFLAISALLAKVMETTINQAAAEAEVRAKHLSSTDRLFCCCFNNESLVAQKKTPASGASSLSSSASASPTVASPFSPFGCHSLCSLCAALQQTSLSPAMPVRSLQHQAALVGNTSNKSNNALALLAGAPSGVARAPQRTAQLLAGSSSSVTPSLNKNVSV
jgi:hypothetical protein